MNKILGTLALMVAIAMPAFAQQGRLSPHDQSEFDKYYTKWVNHTRKNDRDDIAKDVKHMQEIMGRNGIPSNVPYEQIASTGSEYPARTYQGRLSAHDQSEFDKNYTKWINDTRKNDRDDINKDVAHMQEIMARNNIPANVPFDQIASNGAYPNRGYSGGNYSNPAYSSNGQSRLSADDQREFDKYYSKWLEDMRKNDRDDIDKDVRHMQDI